MRPGGGRARRSSHRWPFAGHLLAICASPSAARRRQYADFRVGNDGAVSGVGMMIAADPSSGKLVVLAPIRGSPAERAGIQPGDEVRALGGGGCGRRVLGGSSHRSLHSLQMQDERGARWC